MAALNPLPTPPRDRFAGCYACGAVSGYHEHDVDCPNSPLRDEEWRQVQEDIAEIDERRTR